MCFRLRAVILSPAEYLYGDIEGNVLRWLDVFRDGPRDARPRQALRFQSDAHSCCTESERAQSYAMPALLMNSFQSTSAARSGASRSSDLPKIFMVWTKNCS